MAFGLSHKEGNIARLTKFVDDGYRDGVFGLSRLKHYCGSIGKLSRYLRIHRKSSLPFDAFTADMLMDCRFFASSKLARKTHVDLMNKVQV